MKEKEVLKKSKRKSKCKKEIWETENNKGEETIEEQERKIDGIKQMKKKRQKISRTRKRDRKEKRIRYRK